MSHDTSNSNKEAVLRLMDVLECGSSLAEHEYHEHRAADAADDEAEEEEDPPKADPATTAQFGGEEETIESLRALLASDVLTDEGKSCTVFASPFEVPRGAAHALQQQQAALAGGGGVVRGNNNYNYSSSSSSRAFLQVPLVYCDQTASNRPVKSIERFMERVCLPLYGNTHTNTSITGSQR